MVIMGFIFPSLSYKLHLHMGHLNPAAGGTAIRHEMYFPVLRSTHLCTVMSEASASWRSERLGEWKQAGRRVIQVICIQVAYVAHPEIHASMLGLVFEGHPLLPYNRETFLRFRSSQPCFNTHFKWEGM